MNTETKQTTLDSFCHGAATILGLESALSSKPVDAEWAKKVALWKTGLFRIVVMGEIKKGKSSFINALLGHKDLVPVCSDVATSTIFKICYGPEVDYKVFFYKTSGKASVSVGADELAKYGTEDGNPGNEKQVEFIQVFCPSPMLKAGLVIVDTPGLGGLFKQHKRITYEYVPKADAVFLVTDSVESPIEQKELDLLADLKKVTKHIFFVQTKAHSVGTNACESRRKNNLDILRIAGFDPATIHYFVVDSKTKMDSDEVKDLELLKMSGFNDVARFVNGYIRPNVHRLLMSRAFMEIRPKVDAVSHELAAQNSILKTRTEEDRAKLTSELQEQQTRIAEWEKTGKAEIKDRMEMGLDEILSRATQQLNRFNPNGGDLVLEIERKINGCKDVEVLQRDLDAFQQRLPGVISETLYQICSVAQRETSDLLSEIAGKASSQLSTEINSGVMTSSISQVHQDLVKDTGFGKARTIVYGGMAGMGIGAAIGGIIGGCIGFCCGGVGALPGAEIGGILGGLIGKPFGYFLGYKDQKEHQLDMAQKSALGLVTKWMAAAYQDMNRSFGDTFKKIRRHVVKEFDNAIQRFRDEPAARIVEIKLLRQKTSEEIAAKMTVLRKRQVAFKQAVVEMCGETDITVKEA